MYLGTLETLIARAHPAIRRIVVSQQAASRDILTVTVHAPETDRDAIRQALARSEASFRPRDYVFEYAFVDPS